MKPLKDLVLIQLDPVQKTTASGLHLVNKWETIPPVGVVTAVGDKVTAVKVGDHVIFMQYASIETDEADIRVVKEDHIIGVIDE